MNRNAKNIMTRTTVAAALGAVLGGASGVVFAMPAVHEAVYHEVSEYKLSNMRGRYINGDKILFFGVEMYSTWKTELGDSYAASLHMGVDRSAGTIRPTVTVVSMVSANSSGHDVSGFNSGNVGQISGGGLDQVRGVSQTVQVTGDVNGVGNSIAVNVGTQRPTGFRGGSTNAGSGNQAVTDGATGATAKTYVGHDNVGVSISVPGQGNATQTISSLIGMQQHAQVFGDMNNVTNHLNLIVQLQTNGAPTSSNMSNVLQNVRGFMGSGMY